MSGETAVQLILGHKDQKRMGRHPEPMVSCYAAPYRFIYGNINT